MLFIKPKENTEIFSSAPSDAPRSLEVKEKGMK